MINGKVANCLDEVLFDEDIGGFVGMFLFDSVDDIKDNNDVIKNIFGNDENLEVGDSILMANWKNWSNEEDQGRSVSNLKIFIVGYDLNVLCFDLICVFNINKAIYVKF